jgi:serine/threonine protein kinase
VAPEVIEFRGAKPESDVWFIILIVSDVIRSLGCTIIEILTGDPPYFDHDPMAAMFKVSTFKAILTCLDG